jgi:acylphosphatase
MRKCLKIQITGSVQSAAHKASIQKHAQSLGIEGTIQNLGTDSVVIHCCGLSVNLDQFIDFLYKGTSHSGQLQELSTEPFVKEKDFRGVFRIIGD